MERKPTIETGNRLAAIFDAALFAIINIRPDGTIEDFNPAAEKMFGYSRADVLGENVNILIPEPMKHEHDRYIENYINTGTKRIIGIGREVIAMRKDGSEFPVHLSVSEIRLPNGRLFTGMIQDLSARKDAERRINLLQDELIHVARVSAMGEMASALAHELNQPLTAISNYATAARRILSNGGQDATQAAADLIVKASAQSQRAGEIIRRLRQFVEPGDTDRTWNDLSETVEEAAHLGLVGAKEKGIAFRLHAHDKVPVVLIDKIQLQQVVQNLVRNAVDALDDWQGPRQIDITILPTSNSHVEVLVEDSGPGLAPEIKTRLFEPFITTKSNGMGIGLSISRNIVESHGGKIAAEDGTDGGTRFKIVLPIGNESA